MEILFDLNIGLINEKPQIISSRVPGLYVVEHPQFLTDDDFINESSLSADGLHLSFEGPPIAVSNIESAILEVRRDLLKAECDMLQQLETSMLDENVDIVIQGEQNISTSEEKLPYSDVFQIRRRKTITSVSVEDGNECQTDTQIPSRDRKLVVVNNPRRDREPTDIMW